jgi:zinc protease
LVQIMKELTDYRYKGIKEEELAFTKKSIGQSDALKYETPVQKASFLKRIIMYNLDKTFVDKQNEILSKITKSEISEIAKKRLSVDKMVVVVVGDKKTLKEKLSALNYELVELDKEGKPLQY